MKTLGTVLAFTFREQVRKKSFIISTVIILLLVVAGMCVPSIIGAAKNAGGAQKAEKFTLYVVDPQNVLASELSSGDGGLAGCRMELRPAAQAAALQKLVKGRENRALLTVTLKSGVPALTYYVHRSGDGPDPSALAEAVRVRYARGLLGKEGVSPSLAARAASPVSVSTVELGKGLLSGMLASMLLMILLFFFIYMYGYWVAMSVASEKTSRVMELLVTSAKPSRIVLGKSAAMGLLGLAQLVLILATAAVSYRLFFPDSFRVAGALLNFSSVTPFALAMSVVYFILGFALYAMLNALVGAMVSRAEDIQSALLPVSMISLLSFYFAYSTMFVPGSTAAAVVSIVPFTAPFAMPPRLVAADVPAWQIAASVGLLALTAAGVGAFSIRLYSAAVLHYGRKLRFGELIGLSRRAG